MKKSIIALVATSAIAFNVMAQSNVQIYGTVDAGYAVGSADRTDGVDRKTGIGSLWDASHIGFKGTEQLGNQDKVGFVLEYGLQLEQNTGINNAREQSIFYSSRNLGTIKAGRMATLGKTEIDKFDPLQVTAFSPLTALAGPTINTASRASNTIAYIAPTFGGVTLGATYSTDASSTKAAYGNGVDQERVYGFMADYTNGPLTVGYVYHRVEDLARISGSNITENLLGAKYTVTNDLTVMGSYQNAHDNQGGAIVDNSITSVGAQYNITKAFGVDVGVARLNDKTGADQDATAWGVQGRYNLSKRTLAYAGYTHVSNKNGGTATALGTVDGVTPQGTGTLASSGFGVGLNHRF